jgi:hypothetical protein
MGNQESVPNQKKVLKKKKVLESQKRNQPRNQQYQQSNQQYQQYHQSNQQYQHRNQQQNQHNNLNNYGQKLLKRENISIQNDSQYNDFSNYNYEIKTKNSDLNDALVNRTMIQNKTDYLDHTNYLERPTNSNALMSSPKPNFDNIKFNPNNFNDQVNEYRTSIETEKSEFEENIKKQKDEFYEYHEKKRHTLEEKISEFEENYDPWDILGLEHGDLNVNNIKKAYKRCALKYHPDKAGPKYENLFNVVNQSYIYLLHKAEETQEIEMKTTQDVTKREYESYNDGMINMHIDKDNFNINKFNEIFNKFKLEDENDQGYGDLLKNEKDVDEKKPFFNSKVSNQIFNEHFNKIKDKKSQAIVEFQEPLSLNTQGTLNAGELGQDFQGGFGSSQDANLGYTDIKQAYYEDNLLINPDKVKIKKYRNVDEYESERSKMNYKPNEQEKMRYIEIEKKNKERERMRIDALKTKDVSLTQNYNKINKKLIVHKK